MPYPLPLSVINEISDGATTSHTVTLPHGQYAVGDALFIAVGQDTGGSTISTPSGWSKIGTQAASGASACIGFWKKAASVTETNPTFTTSTGDEWVSSVFVIKDVPASAIIDVFSRGDWNATNKPSFPSVNTTGTIELIIHIACCDSDARIEALAGTMFPLAAVRNGGTVSMFVGYSTKATAGATGDKTFNCSQSDEGGNAWSIAVKNVTGGGSAVDPSTVMREIGMYGTTSGVTMVNATTYMAAINGTPITATTPAFTGDSLSTVESDLWGAYGRLNSAVAADVWAALAHQLPAAMDMTGGIFSMTWRVSSLSHIASKGVAVGFVDGSGNWVAYTVREKPGMLSASPYTKHIALGVSTPLDSSGTMNWADVVAVVYGYHRLSTSSTGQDLWIRHATVSVPTSVVTGGSAGMPVDALSISRLFSGTAMIGKADFAGLGQIVQRQSLQIGDGSTPTYLDFNGVSYEFAKPSTDTDIPADATSLTIYACPTCTMRMRNCALNRSVPWSLTIHPSSSTLATYDFSGAWISNGRLTLKSGITYSDAKFFESYEVDCKAGTFVDCLFRRSLSTSAAKADPGATFTRCEFSTDTPANHGLRIPAAGDYYFHQVIWTGSTVDIDASEAGGTVTIHLDVGDEVPTYTGPVVIEQAVVTATGSVIGMPAGGRLWIYNNDTATEMVNAIQAGTSYSVSYPDGTGYTDGDTVHMRWRHPDYEDVDAITIATSGGWSFTVQTVLDPHYSGLTPANATVDFVNKKIRATGSRANFLVQELVDIIKNSQATEDGIRLAAFADISGLVELTPGVFTALTCKLLDWQASWASGSVAQASITEGNLVGGIAGDQIEDVVGGPQVAILQAQSGTVVAVGSGVTAQDKIDIANQTKTTMEAVGSILARINALIENSSGDRFTAKALEAAPAGGGGTADWTTTERSQIRKRLGIDGTTASPSATPDLSLQATVDGVLSSVLYVEPTIAALSTMIEDVGWWRFTQAAVEQVGSASGSRELRPGWSQDRMLRAMAAVAVGQETRTPTSSIFTEVDGVGTMVSSTDNGGNRQVVVAP